MIGVIGPNGQVFTFAHQGSAGGVGAPTQDDNWMNSGTSSAIVPAFSLLQGFHWQANAAPAIDFGAIGNDVAAIGFVEQVVAIVGPLFS